MFVFYHYIHPTEKNKNKRTDMLSNYTSCLLVSGDFCNIVIFSSNQTVFQPKDRSLCYSLKSCTEKMLKKNLD